MEGLHLDFGMVKREHICGKNHVKSVLKIQAKFCVCTSLAHRNVLTDHAFPVSTTQVVLSF